MFKQVNEIKPATTPGGGNSLVAKQLTQWQQLSYYDNPVERKNEKKPSMNEKGA
ncbi:MAG: hypothetical protein ABSA79_01535 [Candidatus Bathyarchaeia archaeon]